MSVHIYGLWPIGVDRLLFENRITATAAASSLQEARDLVVTSANQRGFQDPQMWLDPDRTCCEELMDADAIPHGFVALHYTPDWGVALPRRLRTAGPSKGKAARQASARAASTLRKGDTRYGRRDEKGRFTKEPPPARSG
jgi:hypothetical protein